MPDSDFSSGSDFPDLEESSVDSDSDVTLVSDASEDADVCILPRISHVAPRLPSYHVT